MPLYVIGEGAEEDVGSHVILGAVVNGTDKKVDTLQGPKDPFHPGKVFVVPYHIGGRKGWFTRTDHVDPVEGFFFGDRLLVPGE
jgi:hypothetical protein